MLWALAAVVPWYHAWYHASADLSTSSCLLLRARQANRLGKLALLLFHAYLISIRHLRREWVCHVHVRRRPRRWCQLLQRSRWPRRWSRLLRRPRLWWLQPLWRQWWWWLQPLWRQWWCHLKREWVCVVRWRQLLR
jgi:hypothetical protein